MTQFFNAGGVFMFVVLALGGATLFFNLWQLYKGKQANYLGLIVGLLCATFLAGICGTGMGFYQAGLAFGKIAVAKQMSRILLIQGYAWTPITFAALFSSINAILFGIAHYRFHR